MTSDSVRPGDLFSCRQCGDCCKGYGGTYMTETDIDNICWYLGLERDTFIKRYCQISGDRLLIAQGLNGYCIFWDHLCSIHPVKPRMCKNWPFIENILVDVSNWQAMAALCPGMRTDFSDEQIKKCVNEVLNKIH